MKKYSDEVACQLQRLGEQINSNQVFTLNKDEHTGLYYKKRKELIVDVYNMVVLTFGEGDYMLELVETVEDCLKYYKITSGPFTHYFMSSFKRRYTRQDADTPFVAKDRDEVIRIKNLLNLRGKDVYSAVMEDVYVVADILELDPLYVEDIVVAERSRGTVCDTAESSDGEEFSIIDLNNHTHISPEEEYILNSCPPDLLNRAQAIYEECIASQKQVISKYFTAEVGQELLWCDIDYDSYDIIDRDIMVEYAGGGAKLTERELAKRMGKLPSSINRTYGDFKEKLQENKKKDKGHTDGC